MGRITKKLGWADYAHCRNTNFVQNPLLMLARIWNHLPENIRAIENVKLFTKNFRYCYCIRGLENLKVFAFLVQVFQFFHKICGLKILFYYILIILCSYFSFIYHINQQ
jgi:hypothetical protein